MRRFPFASRSRWANRQAPFSGVRCRSYGVVHPHSLPCVARIYPCFVQIINGSSRRSEFSNFRDERSAPTIISSRSIRAPLRFLCTYLKFIFFKRRCNVLCDMVGKFSSFRIAPKLSELSVVLFVPKRRAHASLLLQFPLPTSSALYRALPLLRRRCDSPRPFKFL